MLRDLAALFGILVLATYANAGERASVVSQWASETLHEVSLDSADLSDLEPLRDKIGNARVVSFGEGLHGALEPLQFRNRLFRFLVEEMGFTAIALESGFIESFVANDYVQGGQGDVTEVARSGITYGFGKYHQQVELLQWMRAYNAERAPDQSPIEFYGMDVSGTPGEPLSALDHAMEYLSGRDPAIADEFNARIAPHRDRLKINRGRDDKEHYAYLPQPARDLVTATIADLVSLYDVNELAWKAATDETSYARARAAAIAARQRDSYLRQFPVGWTPATGGAATMRSVEVADRAKLANIEWIFRQQGARGKLLIFAHLGHVATTRVSITLPEQPKIELPAMLGEYLAARFRGELVTVGHMLGRDDTPCREQRMPAAAGSLEGELAAQGAAAFILDLKRAPTNVRERWSGLHGLYGTRPTHSLDLAAGVDLLLFTQRATPAQACH